MLDACEPVTFIGLCHIEAFAVIPHGQCEPALLEFEINVQICAIGMTRRIVQALFEDQENLPAHFRVERQVLLFARRAKPIRRAGPGQSPTYQRP